MDTNSESILNTIKKLVGVDKDYGAFDMDLIVAINGAFMILDQLGVGPENPFSIKGEEETWTDFSSDIGSLELVKNDIYLRARLLFDPPSTGVLHEAMERQISEFEWRLMIQADPVTHGVSDRPGDDSGDMASVGGIADHRVLVNRDAPDQHPIEAITGLEKEVKQIPRVMTAEEMRDILLS